MLALPGFIEAHYFDPERADDGRWIHTVQYILSNQEALDAYLENDAPRMRQDGLERFGDALEASRSVRELVAANDDTRCLNCDAPLRGQYCWNCGQRGNTRLISLVELIKDAFGDMFELDSRLWRTLIPLVRRPGHLTEQYLQGRRARFMPPFRMYLVLSFLFFLLSQLLGDGPGVNMEGDFSDGVQDGVTETQQARLVEDLESAGISPEAAAETVRQLETAQEAAQQAADAVGQESNCEFDRIETGFGWIDRQFPMERQVRICEDITRDKGRRIVERWIDNAPVAALAVLPIMALLLKALYPLSRRYYVEHLLMLVHFHSFLFLLWSAGLTFNGIANGLSAPNGFIITINVIGWLFVPVYLYRAIRVVYGQGRFVSLLKFLVMLTGYFAATLLVIASTFAWIIATY